MKNEHQNLLARYIVQLFFILHPNYSYFFFFSKLLDQLLFFQYSKVEILISKNRLIEEM